MHLRTEASKLFFEKLISILIVSSERKPFYHCAKMLKGQVNELNKKNFNNILLKFDKQPGDILAEDNYRKKREWNVQPSQFAINTTNPIRAIVEHLNVQPNPDKTFIPLSVGELIFNFFFPCWKKKTSIQSSIFRFFYG